MGPASVAASTDIEGTYTITSVSPNRTALAPEDAEFTVFTQQLVEVLRHGITGAEKLITVERIFDQIDEELQTRGLPRPWRQGRNNAARVPLIKNRAIARSTAPPGYGEIPGFREGTHFRSREELSRNKVHRPPQAGICGRQSTGGAESIVLSGGYADDQDYGDVIIYTGHGGQQKGRQVKDQVPTDSGNAALLTSITTRYPVRVIRGAGGDETYSPDTGFSYDGLYTVKSYAPTIGVDGFRVLQFRLDKLQENAPPIVPSDSSSAQAGIDLYRWAPVGLGIYGDRRIADEVKRAHNHECQVCGVALQTPAGFRFADSFYLKSLARPHRGPDIAGNILCVCPTHRVQLELGAITIDDNLDVIDEITGERFEQLEVNSKHRIDVDCLRYHRRLYHQLASPPQDRDREA
jgi:predicted restriction endonuclease